MSCDKPASDKQEAYMNACKSNFYKTTECSTVKRTRDNYSTCTSDISAVSCEKALELTAQNKSWIPATCANVFE